MGSASSSNRLPRGSRTPADGPAPAQRALLRRGLFGDGPALARLATQLGYPDFAQDNLRWLLGPPGAPDEELLVLELAGAVVGFIHLRLWRTLLIGTVADIGGLVVDAQARGGGHGRRLVEAGAEWARAHGAGVLQARSGSTRSAAHDFYAGLGFDLRKEQLVFHLALNGGTARPGHAATTR